MNWRQFAFVVTVSAVMLAALLCGLGVVVYLAVRVVL
jgi:hypothetical protein